jgi:hypothetical protein
MSGSSEADARVERLLGSHEPVTPSPAFEARVLAALLERQRALGRTRDRRAGTILRAALSCAATLALAFGLSASMPTRAVESPAPLLAPVAAVTSTVKPVQPVEDAMEGPQRFVLADGSVLFLDAGARASTVGKREIRLERGRAFLEVARGDGAFSVHGPAGNAVAHGTKLALDASEGALAVAVAQGRVSLEGESGAPVLLGPGDVGEVASRSAPRASASPRLSSVVAWARDLYAIDSPPLAANERPAYGEVVAVDPSGQESRLSVERLHVDVHVEDGVARTTIDTTYFNHLYGRLEGTFYFPVPAGASITRLAMYVDGKLMEGGVAERDEARSAYEQIVSKKRDPALLEWMEGNVFKMRIFPLEGRQEKRVIVSFTQELEPLYGALRYALPLGGGREVCREHSVSVRIKGGARLGSSSHAFKSRRDGDDLVLEYEEKPGKPRNVAFSLEGIHASPVATCSNGEGEYVMARFRPAFGAAREHVARNVVVIADASGSRKPVELEAQKAIVARLVAELDDGDRYRVLTVGTRVRSWKSDWEPVRGDPRDAIAFVSSVRALGTTNLEAAFREAARELAGVDGGEVVYLGDGIATEGETDTGKLAALLPRGLPFVGVGVGKSVDTTRLEALAGATGGLAVEIDPEESIAWRVFDLVAALGTERLTGIDAQALDADGKVMTGAELTLSRTAISEGEEVRVTGRFGYGLPVAVRLRGSVGGKAFEETLTLRGAREAAFYLPRLWARGRVERLAREGAAQHKAEIVALGKRYFLATPFTSLLVLENDEMYTRLKVERGPRDLFAFYESPERVPVVTEMEPAVVPVTVSAEEAAVQAFAQSLLVRWSWLDGDVWLPRYDAFRPADFTTYANPQFERWFKPQWHAHDDEGHLELSPPTQLEPGFIRLDQQGKAMLVDARRPLGQIEIGSIVREQAKMGGVFHFVTDLSLRDTEVADLRGKLAQYNGTGFYVIDVSGSMHWDMGQYGLYAKVDAFTQVHDRISSDMNVSDYMRNATTLPQYRWPGVAEGYVDGSGYYLLKESGVAPIWQALNEQRPGRIFAGMYGSNVAAVSSWASPTVYPLYGDAPEGLVASLTNVLLGQDLTLLAPGFRATAADVLALAEAENISPVPTAALTHQDPVALGRLAAARRAFGTRHVTLGDLEGTVSGDGRAHLRHRLPTGLVEEIVVRADAIDQIYPELGLATHRPRSRFHESQVADLFPFLPPTTASLAGFDVAPLGTGSVVLTPVGSPALRLELDLSPEGLVTERRAVTKDNTVLVRASATPFPSEPAPPLSLEAPLDGLVVIDMPARTTAHAQARLAAAKTDAEKTHATTQLRYSQLGEGTGTFAALVAPGTLGQYLAAMDTTDRATRIERLRVFAAGHADGLLPRLALCRAAEDAFARSVESPSQDPFRLEAFALADDLLTRTREGVFALKLARDAAPAATTPDAVSHTLRFFDAAAETPGLALAARREAAALLVARSRLDEAAARYEALYKDAMAQGFFPTVDANVASAISGTKPEKLTAFLERALTWATAGKRSEALLAIAWSAHAVSRPAIVERALLALPAELSPEVTATLASILPQLQLAGRAEAVGRDLLTRPALRDQIWLHDLVGLQALAAGHPEAALADSERALALELALPAVNLDSLRSRYEALMAIYRSLGARPDLAPRILAHADRWRALDADNPALYAAVAQALLASGADEDAWEVASTAIEHHPEEGAPWSLVAGTYESAGRLERAATLYAEAARREPTDPTALLEQAHVLEKLGDKPAARAVYTRIVGGTWQDRFAGIVEQAKAALR